MCKTDDIRDILRRHKIVPVVTLGCADQAVPLADALVAGGLPIAEVTFRTEAAEETLCLMAQRDDLLVGAGTVLTIEQVDRAHGAGARFAMSPGLNPKIVRRCQEIGLPIFPGVSSPTDIEMALELGLRTVKFFPAEALGGLSTLNAMAAPYSEVQFIPTGGIDPNNVGEYLVCPRVLACGGSWMVKPDLYAQDFVKVREAARSAKAIVESIHSSRPE